jgi:hypothetical protein
MSRNDRPRSTRSPIFVRWLVRRDVVCLALIINIIIWPAPDLSIFGAPVRSVLLLAKGIFGRQAESRQETMADRIARVSDVRVSPQRHVGYLGERVAFAAVGTDWSGEVVHGLGEPLRSPKSGNTLIKCRRP